MKKNLLTGIALVMAFLITPGCNRTGKTTVTEENKKELVKTSIAQIQEIRQTEEFTSTILPYKENNISPSLAVRIDRINVEVGDNVRKGQLLVKMDPSQYNQAAVQLANTEVDYERMKTVYEAGGVSKQQLDAIEAQYLVQKESADNLQVNIDLRSPIDGVVTERNYDPGDLYNGTPILKVMQINTLKVSVDVAEKYFPLVKIGMPAEISIDMYPGKTFPGKVSLISPAIDRNTRSFNVEITIPNHDKQLTPGMFSRTSMDFGTTQGIMIDDLAVQKQLGSNDKYVFIVKDGKAERRLVTTGRQMGSLIEILSGVYEGDEVVVAGISRLVTGTEVEVRND